MILRDDDLTISQEIETLNFEFLRILDIPFRHDKMPSLLPVLEKTDSADMIHSSDYSGIHYSSY